MKRKSNQRITKIKKDRIEDLLKQAENTYVQDGTVIQEAGAELVPYPNFDQLRTWTRKYITKGLDKILINNIDSTGKKYITTLIDGLPLFTSTTKAIGKSSVITSSKPYDQSQYTLEHVDVIDESKNCEVSTGLNDGSYFSMCWNNYASSSGATFHSASGQPQTVLIHLVNPLNLTSINFMNRNITPLQPVNTVTISGSDDGSTWEVIGTGTNPDPNTTSKTWSVDLSSNTKYYNYFKLVFQGSDNYIALNKCQFIGSIGQFGATNTTKPGLWLSNLIQPRSATTAGSYICHNLINTTPLDSPNLDTLGQYSYSFLQRGIYHRTSGSVHYNHDSYAQHWSPSYLSCISHDSLIIPFNNLRRTYTLYQTLVFPVDPDMQEYEETASKDIEYKFVNNDDQTIPTITDFNGRIVGEGWSYEFMFTPNGDGSGNNYGDGDNPGNDNGSNGGCVTGTITYSDSAYENSYCTQTINTCFQTIGSYFNPDVPDLSNYKLLDDGTNQTGHFRIQVNPCGVGPIDSNITDPDATFPIPGRNCWINATFGGWKSCGNGNFKTVEDAEGEGNWTAGYHWYGGNCSNVFVNFEQQNPECSGCGHTGCGAVIGSATWTQSIAPLQGVDIYMIITDLKCQYEDQGLPWTHGCGTDRFTYYFSTQKSTNKCDKNILIASNIDINKLGDISKLNSGNFKG